MARISANQAHGDQLQRSELTPGGNQGNDADALSRAIAHYAEKRLILNFRVAVQEVVTPC